MTISQIKFIRVQFDSYNELHE